ncbi:MAG: gamma-glutamyltranspeptidase / glutathione hydrolase [Solirubrobacteraceae bacterium]|nr:gamma-glutamyltranspeptidase / glutathione hydrolase [Solirubrobacteraceae bacterium]
MTGRSYLRRPPTVSAKAMVATSQAAATQAGLRALERGGTAADAAVAAAAVLCVTEPMSTGIGGDAFAIVWDRDVVYGLDAAGPAPRSADPDGPIAQRGPRSTTVPGSVAGWDELVSRFGTLGLDRALQDAIDMAETGVAAGVRLAEMWASQGGPSEAGETPRVGSTYRLPMLGRTLRKLAEQGPRALYQGEVAAAIAASTWLEESDLADYSPQWVEPLSVQYRDALVYELPPPTQGVAALEALGMLALEEPTLEAQVRSVRRALEDAFAHVRDGADVGCLLRPEHLAARARTAAAAVTEPPSGTAYLCVVDERGMAVSFIQSLYEGSGVEAPGTGIHMQNRAGCFAVNGAIEPGRRPYHTIIPGLLVRDGALLGPFGVMGGFIQAQAHVQLVSSLIDDRLDPQAALDRPRFRVEGEAVRLEEGMWESAEALQPLGGEIVLSSNSLEFGSGQAIMREGDVLVGGSDSRRDGYAGVL